jgi:hypothetical protein
MYLSESEYQTIVSKAELLETSSSKFTKQAVQVYLTHLEKCLKDAESLAA